MKYVIEKEVTKQAVCAIQLNLNSPVAKKKKIKYSSYFGLFGCDPCIGCI